VPLRKSDGLLLNVEPFPGRTARTRLSDGAVGRAAEQFVYDESGNSDPALGTAVGDVVLVFHETCTLAKRGRQS
jgi:hypothetical protein